MIRRSFLRGLECNIPMNLTRDFALLHTNHSTPQQKKRKKKPKKEFTKQKQKQNRQTGKRLLELGGMTYTSSTSNGRLQPNNFEIVVFL